LNCCAGELRSKAFDVIDMFNGKLYQHHEYIRQHMEDMPEIRNWSWMADFKEPTSPPPLAKDILAQACSQLAKPRLDRRIGELDGNKS
jgi:hypothetical protein